MPFNPQSLHIGILISGISRTPLKPIVLVVATAFALWAAPATTFAWGADAHRAIAAAAYQQLDADVRLDVDHLLSLEPGSSLQSLSTWADEHRSPTTARWHYVNFPSLNNCQYQRDRDCPDGQCVVGAIERYASIFRSGASDVDRLTALKYLVHLVADVHQPLHAGLADDKGGNGYQVNFAGRGTNLHALWDSQLIAARPALLDDWPVEGGSGTPTQWAEESCRLLASHAVYPSGHRIGRDYLDTHARTIQNQLAKAAARLVQLLSAR